MSNMTIGNIGDTVRLQLMQCRQIYVGGVMIGYGYTPLGSPFSVVITQVHLGFITGGDLKLYKMQPEHDDDYYAVIAPPYDNGETVTIPKIRYERLRLESQFLSALEAHGVDNWDGYSDAYRDSHDDDEEEDNDE